jgi:hypothetical protein
MKKEEKKIIKELNKNLVLIYSKCDVIFKRQKKGIRISEKDYIWFMFSADIYYRIKDITFLIKKLKEAKNSFDSSLYVLSRSVLETFIYFKYLLCEEDKIMYRLRAFICYSTRKNEISILNSLKKLHKKGKFIFDHNPNNILSSDEMIDQKVAEWNNPIVEYTDFYKQDPFFVDEIKIFEKIERVAQKYDEINNINSVTDGLESTSMEWMYNYFYRFLCMPAHQSIRDKEKVFNLFDNKKEPNNIHILFLLNNIVEQILFLKSHEKGQNNILEK